MVIVKKKKKIELEVLTTIYTSHLISKRIKLSYVMSARVCGTIIQECNKLEGWKSACRFMTEIANFYQILEQI